ncbi:MAG TPA: hypothetical protein PL029_03085 [Bacteroidia bacterium]|nr:hypothetical protein [Bacteroidia bacterium]
MLKAAKISDKETQKTVAIFAITNCILFIIAVISFKYLNLLHFWGLRITNYVIISVVSIYQVNRLIRNNGGYVPFLQAFVLTFITGIFSFMLYAAFIYTYSFFDPYLAEMFITGSVHDNRLMPAIIVFFEGSGASIIVALIAMVYASRFEDGEKV